MLHFPTLAILPPLCAALLLSSCISHSTPAKIYVLPQTDGAVQQALSSGHVTFVLPAYLSQVNMRLHDAATGEIRILKDGLWASSPAALFAEALAARLQDTDATIRCTEFTADFAGTFHASGTFRIANGANRTFDFTLPPKAGMPRGTASALVMQYQDAIQQLASLIKAAQ